MSYNYNMRCGMTERAHFEMPKCDSCNALEISMPITIIAEPI